MIPVVPDASSKGRRRKKKRAFTLVEILASLAVSCLVMAAIATIVVMSAKIIEKGKQADTAATQTRLFQETLIKEISLAVADTVPIDTTKLVGPNYSGASSTNPVRYSRVTYRVIVGRVAYVTANTPSTQTQITLTCPPDFEAAAGDYLMMDTPELKTGGVTGLMGALIDQVDDPSPPNARPALRTVTLTLDQTIAASTIGTVADVVGGVNGVRVSVQRQRAFQVMPSTKYPSLYEMRWYTSTPNITPPTAGNTESYQVISSNLAASAQYPFIKIPDSPTATQPAVGWEFTYAVPTAVNTLGGQAGFYQANHSEGEIMPRSGSPMPAASLLASSSSTSTTSTSTTSSTSTSTSTSTTSTSTSTTTSSTSTSTSISTTSTSISTTSTSTTSTTSTTTSSSTTSTSTTSTSTTKTTTSTSTTSTSTTSTSTSTTSTSTTSTSTTKTTTSTSTSTSTKTTTSTSTTSTSTTSTSTTKTTTSTSTSTSTTTKSSTSTTSTSTTSTSTTKTTTSTSTSTKSTTSTSTSTSTSTKSTTSSTSTSSTSTSSTSKSTTSTTTTSTSTTTTSTSTSTSTTSTSTTSTSTSTSTSTTSTTKTTTSTTTSSTTTSTSSTVTSTSTSTSSTSTSKSTTSTTTSIDYDG